MQKRVFFDENEKSGFKPYHKVRDQCHYTGKFIGAAHSICNLRYKVPKEIPTVFHNGSSYVGFELAIRNSQFTNHFGSLRMSFCIFF